MSSLYTFYLFEAFVNVDVTVIVQSLKSYPTLCNPMDCTTPGSSVLHYLLEFTQINVH